MLGREGASTAVAWRPTMRPARHLASMILGVILAAAPLKLTACSAIDPNPPDPHGDAGEELQRALDGGDGGDGEAMP